MKSMMKILGISSMDAAVTKPECSFAKAKLQVLKLAGMLILISIMGFAFVTCGGETECDFCGELVCKCDLVSSSGIEMRWIPAGTFTMGSPENEPGRSTIENREVQHQVTLTKGFYMGKFQVTQAQWKAVMGNENNPSYFNTNNSLPVEQVSWFDAIIFCNKLSISEGLTPAYSIGGKTNPAEWGDKPTSTVHENYATWNTVQIVSNSNGYRLPTEAQWEYACRAGTTTAFNWGSNVINDTQANYWASYVDACNLIAGTNKNTTTVQGTYPANAWGLYDMHGNVWEWCWDWFDEYSTAAKTNPTGAVSGSFRVFRGGSWISDGQILRSAYRGGSHPSYRNDNVGFRLLRP